MFFDFFAHSQTHVVVALPNSPACPSITSDVVVRMRQLQISHRYTWEIEETPPPASPRQIYRSSLERWAVACGAEPILFKGETLPVSLVSHLYYTRQTYPRDLLVQVLIFKMTS